jgi:hypothetical protein
MAISRLANLAERVRASSSSIGPYRRRRPRRRWLGILLDQVVVQRSDSTRQVQSCRRIGTGTWFAPGLTSKAISSAP